MEGVPLIFLSAGEASGDHYGADLIAALRQKLPEASFTGLGGREMEQAGQQRVVCAEDVAVMGITEILRHIPRILGSYRALVRSIKRNKPTVAVLIDFPDVNFRLAKQLKRLGVPVIWFVSPQLWAWKRRRLRWVQSRVDRIIVIFPFEQEFYDARGVAAEFVGHPLAHLALPSVSREEYAASATQIDQTQWKHYGSHEADWLQLQPQPDGSIRYALAPEKKWIALLPGSRYGEIKANLRPLIEAAAAFDPDQKYEFLIPVASSAEKHLSAIQHNAGALYLPYPNPPRITFVRDARAALLHSRAAVVASGTATVQAAVIGTPFIVVYRVSKMTFRLAKRLVRYPAEIPAQVDAYGHLPIGMVNLIAGRRIVPELLQEHFTGANVAAALAPLVHDTTERAQQIQALEEVRRRLTLPGASSPVQRVCDAVLAAIQRADKNPGSCV